DHARVARAAAVHRVGPGRGHRGRGRGGRQGSRMSRRTSVIICVYTEDRWEDIGAAVESVRRQRRQPHELIIVVDHNPDLCLRLKREHPDAIVVENAQARGLSVGRNTGAGIATGDLVASLDDDAISATGSRLSRRSAYSNLADA